MVHFLEKLYYRFIQFAFVLYIFVGVLFPGDYMGIKTGIFLILFLLSGKAIFLEILKRENAFLTFFTVCFPTVLIFHSFVLGNDLSEIMTSCYFLYTLSIIYIADYYDFDFEKYFICAITVLASMTIVFAVLDFSGIFTISDLMMLVGSVEDFTKIFGKLTADEGNVSYYKIYFRASALIVFLLFYSISKKKYFLILLAQSSLLLAGTRACMIFPVICLLIWFLYSNRKLTYKSLCIYGFIGISLFIFFVFIWNDFFTAFFLSDASQYSDTIRRGHIESLITLWEENPFMIIFGSGMGSYFYTSGFGEFTNKIEWYFLDTFRQMGFFLFFIYSIFIIWPYTFKNLQSHKLFAYSSFLMIAATNPILGSSIGVMAFAYLYINKSISK